MNRPSKLRILLGLLAFRLLVAFVVAVWGPYLILSVHPGRPFAQPPVTVCGALLTTVGTIGYFWSAWDFALIGLSFGPPALVARGVYALLRHPMYFSLTLSLVGESLLFESWRLLGYAAVFGLMVHVFVVLYEEPRMMKKWGAVYQQYSEQVGRWVPRPRF